MADYSDPLGLLFGGANYFGSPQKSQGLLQLTPQEIERMAAAQSPAFGVFPQMQPYRSQQDITASANVPVDVMRGRIAGTRGLFGDVVNQPIPMVRPLQLLSQALTGQQKYPDTEYYLDTMPLKSDTPIGDVAGRIGSFAPINPMPAVKGVQKLGGLLGEEMATRLNTGRPILPSLLAEPQTAMFAVNPAEQAMTSGLLQAEVSPLGFYSAVEQQALKIPRKQGTGESFLNDLLKGQDVKKYEIEAMGLDTYLKGKPNVTRQEVQDFIQNNKIDVQEVQLGGQQSIEHKENVRKALDSLKAQEVYLDSVLPSNISQLDRANLPFWAEAASRGDAYEMAKIDKLNLSPEVKQEILNLGNKQSIYSDLYNTETIKPPKYENYQLAGGENYRELLLKMPNQWDKPKATQIANEEKIKALRQEMYGTSGTNEIRSEISRLRNENTDLQKQISEAPIYKSSHFDQPNILAHMRVNDRVDAEGKKMLLIEEVQSDWHQAGRERGYGPKIERIVEAYYETKDGQRVPIGYGKTKEEAEANIDVGWKNQVDIKYETSDRKVGEGVPDAPFKDTWYQLALKRAIKEAVDKGYDRIGLTTGAQQAERYKLTNEVDEINVIGRTDARTGEKSRQVALDLKSGGSYKLGVNNEGIIDNVNMLEINNLQGKKLADVVGKEVAKKIMESNSQTIRGEGLNIGGEGMKKYYDEIYPNFLNKYGKKYGAQVGEVGIGLPQKTSSSWAYFRDWFAENHSNVGSSNTALSNWEQGSNNKYVKEFEKFRKTPTQKETVRYLDITPEMKKAVQKGQPLAAVEGMTGLLA